MFHGHLCWMWSSSCRIRLRKKAVHERFVHDRLVFQGAVPFLVSCTCGTTVRSGFDPLDLIADVCEKHKLWMHVDVSHPLKDEYVHMCVYEHTESCFVVCFRRPGEGACSFPSNTHIWWKGLTGICMTNDCSIMRKATFCLYMIRPRQLGMCLWSEQIQ